MAKRRKASERREPTFDEPKKASGRPAAPAAAVARPERAAARASSKSSVRRRGPIRRIAYWSSVGLLWAVIATLGVTIWIGAHLPPIQSLEIPKRPPAIQIVDVTGHSLALRGDLYGAVVSLKNLPRYVPQAFVAIEDRRFHAHYGIDPIGVARAAAANLMHRGVAQGGSTLTQQLAKNLFLTQERTWKRKVQELGLALWLEHKFSKTEILELYLNRVYFGAGAYGIEAASQRYFDKPAQRLTLAEAATLAGLVRSPSRLAPSRNPDGAERRAQTVLAAMREMNVVDDEMVKQALMVPAKAVKNVGAGSVNYVADWVMDVLDDLIGRVEQDIVVETSIDPVLQAAAERALVDELNKNGDKAGVGQGALVALTPQGAVRALVGGRNYAESQFNRAVAAKRQPGSAFKPFVYLTAIERGLLPETVREDKAIVLKGWRPENYSREYYGPVTLQQALAFSLNTVAVRLTLEFGPPAVIRTAHRLGIASKLEANPSIALGTSEVTVLEMASAFAPFANGGQSVTPHVVERVRAMSGKTLYTRPQQSLGRVVEPRYVGMMNAMMQETLLTGTAKKAAIDGWPAAGKTGTSQDFRDAWFIGYTAHLVTAVWLGNDDSSPTKKTTGGGMPVEIWSRFMKPAHQNVAIAALPGLVGRTAIASAPAEPEPASVLPFALPWSSPSRRTETQAAVRPPMDLRPEPQSGGYESRPSPPTPVSRPQPPSQPQPQPFWANADAPRPPGSIGPQGSAPRGGAAGPDGGLFGGLFGR